MRGKPLAILMVPAAVMVYLILREAGHLAACAALGIPFSVVLEYGFLPMVHIPAEAAMLTNKSLTVITLSGPAAALLAGYILLYAISRRGPGDSSPLLLLEGITCYACLILDPTYYSAIPLFNLGGEPETLAFAMGVAISRIQATALVLLVLNVILARRTVIPLMRR